MSAWYNIAGYVGVLLVALAFLLLQAHKLHGNGWIYQVMNILGGVGVMLSLIFGAFNWPAFVLEVVWVLIGLYGIMFNRRRRKAAQVPGGQD